MNFLSTYIFLVKRVANGTKSVTGNCYHHINRNCADDALERMPKIRKGQFVPCWVDWRGGQEKRNYRFLDQRVND